MRRHAHTIRRTSAHAPRPPLVRISIAAGIVVALWALAANRLREVPKAAWESDPESASAYATCKALVANRLAKVDDGSFAAHEAVTIKRYVFRRYAIDSYVQAIDPFGLPRRSYFFCVVERRDDDWRQVYLEIS
jgi:hypothetical protein